MRLILPDQMQLGEVDITDVELDWDSRDEVPQVLLGLQHIYADRKTRQEIFQELEKLIPSEVRTDVGRMGMYLWRILVMGILRLVCNWDYDHLHDQVNNHFRIRRILGHGMLDFSDRYSLQTIKDNVRLFTPEILDRINQIIVKAGHRLLGVADEPLKGKGDSFVVETDVHYPTDINLLLDAMFKSLTLISRICDEYQVVGWRQVDHWRRKVKKSYRNAQGTWRSPSKKTSDQAQKKQEEKKAKQDRKVRQAHSEYIDLCQDLVDRVEVSLKALPKTASRTKIDEIETFVEHAKRQINQIRRRVLQGETIDHSEKVFSLFEPHTRWIIKGKAGVPQELGLPVCVMEDQFGFVLDHLVMEEEVDKDIAVSFVKQAKEKYANLSRCSFDKNFYSPDNRKDLDKVLDVVIMPKKGRLSKADLERETSAGFVDGRRQHAAIESAINGLENAGLDRCPDHSIDGFKRYVGLSILARNLQRIGKITQQKQKKKLMRLAA